MTDELSLFDFDLPREHIATEPARPRDMANLLHVRAQKTPSAHPEERLSRHYIHQLPNLLKEGDLLIANNTEVIRAKLDARRGEAKIGITLDRILPEGDWHALARNARKLRPNDKLTFEDDPVTATVITNEGDGAVVLRFSVEGNEFDAFLERRGALALPPYIARPNGPTQEDDSDYRTIFSQFRGAVAAPTAGYILLKNFSPSLRKKVLKNAPSHSMSEQVHFCPYAPLLANIKCMLNGAILMRPQHTPLTPHEPEAAALLPLAQPASACLKVRQMNTVSPTLGREKPPSLSSRVIHSVQ